jgi:flagellar biosynthesis/type III secretory pathway protein FliH
MSARLLKAGPQLGLAFAPFTIPAKAAPGESAPAIEPEAPLILEESGEKRVEPETQAHAILDAAQTAAARLLSEAQTRVAQIEQEAYEKGLAEARARMNEEISDAVADLRSQFAHTLTELEHREVTTDPDIVLSLARVALERLHPRAVATVLLHPEDFEYVKARRQALTSNSTIEIVADKAVGRGGCVIQSEHGDIDARIEQQFASIERGFFE